MFLGHYGVAFALKRAQPKVSLGTLFVAVQLLDLLWGAFLLLGWEHASIVPGRPNAPFDFWDYPISHSLVGAVLWGIVAAACYYSWPTRDTSHHLKAATIVGLAALSHYPLDVLVHVPDLPIMGNDSPKLGLGLWNYSSITMIAELLFLGVGVAVYVGLRSKRHPVRWIRLSVLVIILVATYVASVYGPLPPSMTVVGVSDLVLLLALAGLAAWADRSASHGKLAAQHLSER